jgi:hypothetical protein
MAPNAQRILTVLERALTAQDPTASLRALTELRTEIDALERVHVSRALQTGATFADVARPLGISRQAAHRRYRDLAAAPPPAPRSPALSAEARAALIRAREEAMRHGSGSIDSGHLLVAIARTARRPLRGLDVEAARRSFGPPTVNAPSPSGFRPSLHALLARDDGPLKLDHLLRAALEDPDGGARRLLDRLGVAPEALREAL